MKKNVFLVMILFNLLYLISCSNQIPEFDKNSAFKFLNEQCELGYRFPGTEEIELCRNYIVSELEKHTSDITKQEFEIFSDSVFYEGVNIIAEFYPEMSRRILLGAHYDTREWADKDTISANHYKPVLGANDGASGVAVLLEIARIISSEQPAQYGVDLVFFDLEDAGNYIEMDTWCLGSKYFAENFKGQKPEKAIIVDLIGDKDLQIFMESFSYQSSPSLTNEIWSIAKELGFTEFIPKLKYKIYDDHLSLIREGFNAVDIIDRDYPYWHTVHDTPDKCSAESLYKVGQVLLNLIYREK